MLRRTGHGAMEQHFDVYVSGFEVNEARAVKGLMLVFGLGESEARHFVQSVPRMAKRRVAAEAAERYERALRAVGAMVELRASQSSHFPTSGRPSLPAPEGANLAASSTASSLPPAPMPVIPRAPRLPSGLLPVAATSEYPADLAPNAQADAAPRAAEASSTWTSESIPLARSATSSGPARDYGAVRHDHVGLSHSFSPSRPGSSLSPSTARPRVPERPWYANGVNQLLVLALLAGASYQAYSLGVFRSDDGGLDAAFAKAGLSVGHYEDVKSFLDKPDSRFEGLARAHLDALLAGVERAGAKRAWVIDVSSRDGARVSRSLLIELPSEAAARRTIFWQHARKAKGDAVPDDVGQPYLRLDF